MQIKSTAECLTFIKLPFVIKIFVLSIFEWPLKTGFCISFFQWSSTDRSYEEPDESRNYRSEKTKGSFNPSPASGNLCQLMITFANSLIPDQARQNVGPDLDSNCNALSPSFLWLFGGFSFVWYLPLPSEQLSYLKSRILPASRGLALSLKKMVIEWKNDDIKSYNIVELWFISKIKWYFSFKSYKDQNYPHLL